MKKVSVSETSLAPIDVVKLLQCDGNMFFGVLALWLDLGFIDELVTNKIIKIKTACDHWENSDEFVAAHGLGIFKPNEDVKDVKPVVEFATVDDALDGIE